MTDTTGHSAPALERGQSVVVYDGLPLSAGSAHGLGRISAHAAYTAWSRFLHECGTAASISCSFFFPFVPELEVSPEVRRLITTAFPPASDGYHRVDASRFDEALNLLVSIEPQPRNPWGMAPVDLWFSASFTLLRPNGMPWPSQGAERFNFQTPAGVQLGTNTTNLILAGKRSMSLALSIPDATDNDIEQTIPWLQSHLPFRLSSKHWTRWTLTKNQNSYRGRKLQPLA